MTELAVTAFPKYEAYKDSGLEWLGEIPEEWETKRFQDLFGFSRGLNITKADLQEEGIPCVSYGEIHSKYGFELIPDIHPLKCVPTSYLKGNKNSLLQQSDFVYADTSEDYEGSGNFTFLNGKQRVFAGYHTLICRFKKPSNERYIAYVLDSQQFRQQIQRAVKGVKVFSITQNILKSAYVWFASKEEQTLIAQFLDQKTAQIDQAIAIKEQQIALLKERKQIIIQQAVTKGLDPNVPMKDSGVEWIGQIPEGWKVIALKRRLKFHTGGTPSTSEEGLYEGNYPWVTISDLNGRLTNKYHYISLSGINNARITLTPKGSLLYSFKLSIGQVAFASQNLYTNEAIASFIPEKHQNLNFYYYVLPICLEKNAATNIYGAKLLNQELIKNALILDIPIQEQTLIAQFLDQKTAQIDQAIVLLENQIQSLKEYKSTLINSAVTGKIKITPEMVLATEQQTS